MEKNFSMALFPERVISSFPVVLRGGGGELNARDIGILERQHVRVFGEAFGHTAEINLFAHLDLGQSCGWNRGGEEQRSVSFSRIINTDGYAGWLVGRFHS